MAIKVGISRALLYHDFKQLWLNFFRLLGAEPVVSGHTNKHILDQGSAYVVDEACLPVKVFFGHAAQLADRVDYLFVPRMVSVEPQAYICPKMMGLPDMLAASPFPKPPLLKPVFNRNRGRQGLADFLRESARPIAADQGKVHRAWQEACRMQNMHELAQLQDLSQLKETEELRILLVAHSYLLDDSFLNMNLLKKLEGMGCRVVLPRQLNPQWKEQSIRHLPKRIFWTMGRDLLGAVHFFSQLPGRLGVILLTSFGCGIDSFIGNMIVRHLQKMGIPHLNLTLDEHTGEAGFNTRLEAFIDMMRWREAVNESYFPSYGEYLGCLERASGICRAGGCGSSSFQ